MASRPSSRCTFCAIVAGEVPSHTVVQNDACVGFLDTRPVFPGHTLIVPRTHRETLMDLDAQELGRLFAVAQEVCSAMERALGAHGTFVAVNNRVSQSVPHVHVHVVPRRKGDGLRGFFWPRTPYASEAEAEAVAGKLREAMERG